MNNDYVFKSMACQKLSLTVKNCQKIVKNWFKILQKIDLETRKTKNWYNWSEYSVLTSPLSLSCLIISLTADIALSPGKN